MIGEETWKSIIEGLKGHPNELLAVGVILTGVAMLIAGVNPWVACGFPLAVYLLYGLKALFDNVHQRQMAEIEVERIETERGVTVRERAKRALERRREKHGGH